MAVYFKILVQIRTDLLLAYLSRNYNLSEIKLPASVKRLIVIFLYGTFPGHHHDRSLEVVIAPDPPNTSTERSLSGFQDFFGMVHQDHYRAPASA